MITTSGERLPVHSPVTQISRAAGWTTWITPDSEPVPLLTYLVIINNRQQKKETQNGKSGITHITELTATGTAQISQDRYQREGAYPAHRARARCVR
jgi:hypothetical protein